jgi:hypothetical protein
MAAAGVPPGADTYTTLITALVEVRALLAPWAWQQVAGLCLTICHGMVQVALMFCKGC